MPTWPKSLGARIDKLYSLRQDAKTLTKEFEAAAKRLPEGRRLERVNAQIAALEEHLIESVKKSELEGAAGKLARCSIRHPEHYSIENPTTFFAYVKRHSAWDLLPKRIAPDAYRERVREGKRVPGVRVFTETKLSVTKR